MVKITMIEVYTFFHREGNISCPIKFTYTAMHGVGAAFVQDAFQVFNLPGYIPVKQQVCMYCTYVYMTFLSCNFLL